MESQIFHIFRNTPLGRETLLQTAYFSKSIGCQPIVYIPEHIKFLFYFENDVVQIDLDHSYLSYPETAREHASQELEQYGLSPLYLTPKNFTASTLPDISTDFDYMCCPRSVSDLSQKIGLGYIGPRVRRIVSSARFPVLITSPAYKEWNSIITFFGGSQNAVNALKLSFQLNRLSGKPLDVFTHIDNKSIDHYQEIIEKQGLDQDFGQVRNWIQNDTKSFEEKMYDIPHDALVVLGAYGHGVIRDIVFGSKMEIVQSILSNNLLIVGPKYKIMR
ncbi:MAG: universal stress protein [Candidatus Magnetomorum sp.]|nr:universal stress protein [Candidatus Magnetomorum sp.]